MTDKHNQHLSALVDGEDIDGDVLDNVLDSMLNDSAQLAQFQRYQLASSMIKNDLKVGMPLDISAAVAAQVSQEPTHSQAAKASSVMRPSFKAANDNWWRSVASVAVAASVALVTVIGVQNYQLSPSESGAIELPMAGPVFETAPFGGIGSPVSFNAVQEAPMLQNTRHANDQGAQQLNQRRHIQSFFVDHQQQSLLSQQELQSESGEAEQSKQEQPE